MNPFSINNKKLKGRFLDVIIKEMKLQYSKLYPSYNITIVYKSKKVFTFIVNVRLTVISSNNINNLSMKYVVLQEYDNINAIQLFSNIPIEEYEKEYDDSKKNYLKEFEEQANAIILSYKLLNHNVKPIEICAGFYCIDIQGIGWLRHEVITGRFRFDDIITYEEMKNNLSYIKVQLKQKLGGKKNV